ncbi:MAG: exodeoxyribonuclease V subunit beta, partial [Burkholderiaceae bacterium]|nr:exodeoxyribonuclease V subunit beta [Burkholderiaceae bacterium]
AWYIASYSALAFGTAPERIDPADEPASAEEANLTEPAAEERGVLEPAGRAATVQHAFERGAEAGTFLHNLLEWAARAGFSSVLERPAVLRDVIARRCRLRNLTHWIDPLHEWLTALLEMPFEMSEASPIRLSALGEYQTEMEFWFSASRVDAEALDRIVCHYISPGEARPALLPRRIHGMFKGFIDLTFQHDGRYYVADY